MKRRSRRRAFLLTTVAWPALTWVGAARALGAAALSTTLPSFAQQPARNVRIGLLGPESASGSTSRLEALRAGLRELGYVEGRNVVMEYRFAEGKYERLPELAADLVRSKVDVIVTSGTPATRAAKQATATIPIVMAASGDTVATGLVASLARPSGNVTGSAFLSPELSAKRLELLKEALPRVRQVAYLLNPANPVSDANVKIVEKTANSFKSRRPSRDWRRRVRRPSSWCRARCSGSRGSAS